MKGITGRENSKGNQEDTAMSQVTCNVCRHPYITAQGDRRRTCPPCRGRYMQEPNPLPQNGDDTILDDVAIANLVETFDSPDEPIIDNPSDTPADTGTVDFGGGEFGGGGAGGEY